jgi:hypothetical protein
MKQTAAANSDCLRGRAARCVALLLAAVLVAGKSLAAQETEGRASSALAAHPTAEKVQDLPAGSVSREPPGPLHFEELGRAYLAQRDWRAADETLTKAIQTGAGPEAHLLRAQALVAEGEPQKARAEMASFLGPRTPKDLPEPIRMVWIQMESQLELVSEAQGSRSVLDRSLPELLQMAPDLKGLEPATTQEELPAILKIAGERVETFFRTFQNVSSQEEIQRELLTRNEKPYYSRKEVFQYLLLKWPNPALPGLEEYRTRASDSLREELGSPERMITTEGFASLAIFFLPAYQADSRFLYLGRQQMDGHEAFVVAFAQQPALARLQGFFSVAGGTSAKTLSQGLAWIDSRTYQIIRLRTDLLFPVPRIHLARQTTEVRYAEVHFKKHGISLWLPSQVEVTVEWKGKLRRNSHFYSEFRLFNVESSWKARSPKVEKP